MTKLRDFLYRLLLGKIVVNVDTKEWGLTPDDTCILCKQSQETLLHLFWSCPKTQMLITWFQEICDMNAINVNLDVYSFILNRIHDNRFHICNFIGVLLKQYIYRCRCMKKVPSITAVSNELEYCFKLELANARLDNKVNKLYKRWSPIYQENPISH